MTKIISAENIDFGTVGEFNETTETGTITNTGTERVTVENISSDESQFPVSMTAKLLEPRFPISSDIYFLDNKKTIQSATGVIATTDQGYGQAGTTDVSGVLTFNPTAKSIEITAPADSSTQGLEIAFPVAWTSENILLVNIILDSTSGYKIYEDITATLGTYNVIISESDGFEGGETVLIAVQNSMETVLDSIYVTVEEMPLSSLSMDATAVASTPEDVETVAGTLTMDATAVASTPTDV